MEEGLDIRWRIERAPKAELHLHLRGAIPVELLTRLVHKHGPVEALRGLPAAQVERFQRYDNLRPFLAGGKWTDRDVAGLFRYDDFPQFLMTFFFTSLFVRDRDDLRELIATVRRRLGEQNIVYTELTIAPTTFQRAGLGLDDLLEELEAAARSGRPKVQWIIDPIRDLGPAAAVDLLRSILGRDCPSIVGLTLGGSEHQHPPEPFAELYALAREHGLRLTCHAGEAAGPESVWGALRSLGVKRIGHGVRSVEDPALVRHLADRRVPLEVCPTSNLATGIYRTYEEHPARALREAGVPLTINTDDPTFFRTTLAEELLHVYEAGVGEPGIVEMLENGFRYAFLSPSEIQSYSDDLRASWRDGGEPETRSTPRR